MFYDSMHDIGSGGSGANDHTMSLSLEPITQADGSLRLLVIPDIEGMTPEKSFF